MFTCRGRRLFPLSFEGWRGLFVVAAMDTGKSTGRTLIATLSTGP
jgi:hypothetical protein